LHFAFNDSRSHNLAFSPFKNAAKSELTLRPGRRGSTLSVRKKCLVCKHHSSPLHTLPFRPSPETRMEGKPTTAPGYRRRKRVGLTEHPPPCPRGFSAGANFSPHLHKGCSYSSVDHRCVFLKCLSYAQWRTGKVLALQGNYKPRT
jgi:hypothetical protein